MELNKRIRPVEEIIGVLALSSNSLLDSTCTCSGGSIVGNKIGIPLSRYAGLLKLWGD